MSRSNTPRHAPGRLVLAIIGCLALSGGFTATVDGPSASAATAETLSAWGYNNAGQLGDGSATDDHSPETISLGAGVAPTVLSAGTYDSLAIGSDHNLYAWGYNNGGQLGDGTTTDQHSPEVVTLAPGVTPTAISAGAFHSLAIGSDDQLYAWGNNDQGELGDGTTTEHDSPEVITLPSGVTPTAIAAGYYDSLVIGSDGNLYAWGYNEIGQLGDGTTIERDSPEVITLAPGVTPAAISSVYFHSMAIGSDGNLYTWGDNINGQLGDGTTTNQASPEVITLAPGVTPITIAAGGLSSMAIGSDGNLYAWGENGNGQLGNGTTTGRANPEVIKLGPGVTPTATISAGYDHSLDVGSDGNLYAWGQNNAGQLGDGTTTDRHSPEVITLGSGGTPTLISAGFEHSLAVGLGTPTTIPVVTLQPTNQTYPSGGSASFTAGASGTPTPTVRWQYSVDHGTSWGNLAGPTSTSTTFTASGLNGLESGWQVRAVFSSSAGSATSDAATLTMTTTPVVTTNPANQTYPSGGSASFTAGASGTPTPTVQWQYSVDHGTSWGNLAGPTSTSTTFTASGLNGLESGWQVRAVFSSSAGSAVSHAATMTMAATPVVTLQPTNQTYHSGGSVSFTATASGTPTPTVQWQYSVNGGSNWANLSGASSTTSTFTASGLNGLENGWQVRAVFSSSAGSAVSHAATMTLTS